MSSYTVVFEPTGRKGQCKNTDSILDCARSHHIGIVSVCGGAGTCGKCRVRVANGQVSKPTARETKALTGQQLADGWRLACQAYPLSDIRLEVSPESMTGSQRLQLEGIEGGVVVAPAVKAYEIVLRHGETDLLAELNRQYGLDCDNEDPKVMRSLPESGTPVQVAVRDREVIAVARGTVPLLGLAIDVGTTKIAAYLVDLGDGRTLASKGAINPQTSYGDDVISRIVAASDPGKAGEMHAVVIEAINGLAADLCAEAGAKPDGIVEAVAVGNTAMHHFLLRLPVKSLMVPPFAPSVSGAVDIKAREIGLRLAPGAYLHVLPNVAGFVGADHVAMLLAAGALDAEGPSLFVDIGTNTEVSLLHNGRITAASCASGPALEGGHIKDGMRAARGAIERVFVSGDGIQVQTIEDGPPVGICGSGILDTLAQMHLAGIVDDGGRMRLSHPCVRSDSPGLEIVLVEDEGGNPAITFSQGDVRQVQLGKAAIRAGIQTLLDSEGCPEEDIRQVVIAGAFGSYIDVESAIEIGMLPSLPVERFRQVGNAAGMGAKLALISLTERLKAHRIAREIGYLELAATPGFSRTFTRALSLGRYRLVRGEKERVPCN